MIEDLDIISELKTRGIDGSLGELAINTLKGQWISEDDKTKKTVFSVIDADGNKTSVENLQECISGFLERFPVLLPDKPDSFVADMNYHSTQMYQRAVENAKKNKEEEEIKRKQEPPSDIDPKRQYTIHDLREIFTESF